MSDPIEAALEAFAPVIKANRRTISVGMVRPEEIRGYMQAAIAAYHAAGGTVAAPVEPTEAMIRAGSRATLQLNDSDVRETYRAMLAAVRQEEPRHDD